jgi:hypothetical protein
MDLIMELIYTLAYHGLGRLIFGKSFDTGENVSFWKKIFLVIVVIVIIIAITLAVMFFMGYGISIRDFTN